VLWTQPARALTVENGQATLLPPPSDEEPPPVEVLLEDEEPALELLSLEPDDPEFDEPALDEPAPSLLLALSEPLALDFDEAEPPDARLSVL
jgi:hypothetical protein